VFDRGVFFGGVVVRGSVGPSTGVKCSEYLEGSWGSGGDDDGRRERGRGSGGGEGIER